MATLDRRASPAPAAWLHRWPSPGHDSAPHLRLWQSESRSGARSAAIIPSADGDPRPEQRFAQAKDRSQRGSRSTRPAAFPAEYLQVLLCLPWRSRHSQIIQFYGFITSLLNDSQASIIILAPHTIGMLILLINSWLDPFVLL